MVKMYFKSYKVVHNLFHISHNMVPEESRRVFPDYLEVTTAAVVSVLSW